MKTHVQTSRTSSPWTLGYRIRMLAWEYGWALLCGWTPKHMYVWRIFVLKCFGASIEGTPFVHQRARIEHPWNLTLQRDSSIGDRTHLYCLGKIKIHPGACIAQEAYLCTGSHNFEEECRPLQTKPIEIESDAFIGARAFILPGVKIGQAAIVGACSVVCKNIPAKTTVAGNPARKLR